MICGKVLMDRNAPEDLTDTPESGYQESKALIARWHGVDRLRYAVTLRFAPTSNLFLGSGLFDLKTAEKEKVRVGLGTDIGAGTSLSLLRTLNEAYKIQKLRSHAIPPFKLLYLATLGGAKTLDLDDKIGNFEPGKEADFTVLDCKATPLLAMRKAVCKTLAEKLFVLAMLGDDWAVAATYILGRAAYKRDQGRQTGTTV